MELLDARNATEDMSSEHDYQDSNSDGPRPVTEADIELEARRLVAAAWEVGIHARLLGGLAIAERCRRRSARCSPGALATSTS